MIDNKFLRIMVVSVAGVLSSSFLVAAPAAAQQIQGHAAVRYLPAVFDGSTKTGWYSYPGQSPKLRISGDQVRITSGRHSTVMLSRGVDTASASAEVWLTHAPISTSSISGLGVMGDEDHAMVIGLGDGNVVLWQLDPNTTKVIAQQQVNAASPLQFRVTGGDAAQVRFYWRHRGDAAWHPLGDAASTGMLASWHGPLRFGLVLDGPQGSQVTFSNYHAASSGQGGPMTAMLFVPR
ncbi:MAG: beta-xylosidase family glycoside hydrolase [Acidobacteriaceae bacterium]